MADMIAADFASLGFSVERHEFEATDVKKGLLMWVVRIAAAGQKVTPGGATEILWIPLSKQIGRAHV